MLPPIVMHLFDEPVENRDEQGALITDSDHPSHAHPCRLRDVADRRARESSFTKQRIGRGKYTRFGFLPRRLTHLHDTTF